jgi:hypothetical protein
VITEFSFILDSNVYEYKNMDNRDIEQIIKICDKDSHKGNQNEIFDLD